MSGDGSVSTYTEAKKLQIATVFSSALAGMGITVTPSAILVLIEAATSGRRLEGISSGRMLQSTGVTIRVQMTIPSSASVGDVKNTFSRSDVQSTVTNGLSAVGVTASNMAVSESGGGGGGDDGLSGGMVALIIILVLLGCLALAGGVYYMNKKKQAKVATGA